MRFFMLELDTTAPWQGLCESIRPRPAVWPGNASLGMLSSESLTQARDSQTSQGEKQSLILFGTPSMKGKRLKLAKAT